MRQATTLLLLVLISLRLTAQPIVYVKPKAPASEDTAFNSGSGIKSISVTQNNLKRLTNLGEVWGFLKYYHPAVCSGAYNWDAQLLRLLPAYLKAPADVAAYKLIENLVDSLGEVKPCKKCSEKEKGEVLQADYAHIFDDHNLPSSLTIKLAFIRDNHSEDGIHYYIAKVENVGNPEFKNEVPYDRAAYPDAGLRLLALYRYWNMIQYFYPHRNGIDGLAARWSEKLPLFIPRFVHARNLTEYTLACLELAASINDSHAQVMSKTGAIERYFGKYILPIEASFVADKLVVTGYYLDTLGVSSNFKKGDIIEKIDGTRVAALVKKYSPLTPASNAAYRKNLLSRPAGALFRSNKAIAHIEVRRNGVLKIITQRKLDVAGYRKVLHEDAGFRMLPGNIGYIYPALLQQDDINKIKDEFLNTKGLIIDLRCYPAAFMPYTFGQWLKCESSVFAKASAVSLRKPGSFFEEEIPPNGEKNPACYDKLVVIIVNEKTISQAEFTAMALRTAPKTIILGSQTAGADGNVSVIELPGGIKTAITGIGIFYPDGSSAQRAGIKIDEPVQPSIKGITEGRDELMERAIKHISGD